MNDSQNIKGCLVVTFGDGNLGYGRAAKRVAIQSRKLPGVDESVFMNSKDLNKLHSERNLERDIFRGWALGHYAWKPFVVLEAVERHRPERLIWSDAGNWVNVNPDSSKTFLDLLETIDKYGGFAYPAEDCPEFLFTAPSVLESFGPPLADTHSPQVEAGVFGLHKSKFYLLEEWAAAASNQDLLIPSGFEDGKSMGQNHHRYDQSLFSLLWKREGLPIILERTFQRPGSKTFDEALARRLPFWTSRHRSGTFSLSMNPVSRALRMLEMLIP